MNKGLPDIQMEADTRGISINRVGVENIKFPLYIATKEGGKVLVYATINLYGSLEHHVKGVNMSRFSTTLMKWKYTDLSKDSLGELLAQLRENLGKEEVEDIYAKITFNYFLDKISPMSKLESVMDYECTFIGKLKEKYEFQLQTKVLTSSSCPCSAAISEVGAHNQRSYSTITVDPLDGNTVWLEDLIKLVEECGSCEVYPLLKRVDEKYVTEKAYRNSKFVEDIGRDISLALQNLGTLSKFKVKVVNEESIHPHDAVSYIARKCVDGKWVRDNKSLKG